MVKEGDCCKCGDTCLITNEVIKGGKKDIAVNCVRDCAWILNKVLCEGCLEGFNKGKRYKKGQLIQSDTK